MNQNLCDVFSQRLTQAELQELPEELATDAATEAASELDTITLDLDPPDDAAYEGIDWKRLPGYQKPPIESKRGLRSWIWRHGYRVWHRKQQKLYFLCKYCHTHKIPGGAFMADQATTTAARHLGEQRQGHQLDSNGLVEKPRRNASILAHMQVDRQLEVSQEAANTIASSISRSRFQRSVIDWIAADNQALRVVEAPAFREMIKQANPLAEQYLWRSHNTVRKHVIEEYRAYVPAVINYLRQSRSLVHITFDNWTSTGGKQALTGICVHHLDHSGNPQDYVLGLPTLHGSHSGDNIASVVSSTLRLFQIEKEQLGYFVLDNATNNDSAIEALTKDYGFYHKHRRLRCSCHIINLAAQQIIFGRDREAFENSEENLLDEEAFMKEWRRAGPLGVLIDVMASICTPQARQLIARFQGNCKHPREVIKPVKTRWNSYCSCFERAVELRGPIDDYIEYRSDEYAKELATATNPTKRQRDEPPKQLPAKRLFIEEGGLSGKDWLVVGEYVQLLLPFKEATSLLEGRGKAGTSGAIWEVLPTFDWLVNRMEDQKERLKNAKLEDPDGPEDHVLINVNLALLKLSKYYTKLKDSPAYYIACRLHPEYKQWLEEAWKVPANYDDALFGRHPREGWLEESHRGLYQMWKAYKDRSGAAATAPDLSHVPKKVRLGGLSSRSEYMRATIRSSEATQEEDDELEQWLREPPLPEGTCNPLQYWVKRCTQYPQLSRLALDFLSIPASATDCERTFSELGDLLEKRRLHMKPDLLSALQSLRSWKRLGLKPQPLDPSSIYDVDDDDDLT